MHKISRAAPARAKLLLIEAIIPDDPNPNLAKMLDIHMLTLPGGLQRTQQEHAEMLSHAGFHFEQEIDIGNLSILEAVAI